MIQPRFYSKWHKLTDVMLGTTYPHEYYDGLPDAIRDPLLQLTDETLEDLDYFDSVLKQFGCNVIRPELEKSSIKEWIDQNKINEYTFSYSIRPPLQPRDAQLVIGDKLVFVGADNRSFRRTLQKHIDIKNIMIHPNMLEHTNLVNPAIAEIPWGPENLSATEITVLGNSGLLECLVPPEWEVTEHRLKQMDWFVKKFPDINWCKITEGGHTDAQWHMIKPGVVLSLPGLDSIDNLLTDDIDVCHLNETDFAWQKNRKEEKASMAQGKWWLPGEESNTDLIAFIDKWMNTWTGEMQETVFDLNVLVLDEHHIVINKSNKKLEDFLKKHNMEPIVVPFRHRYFWDGGLHCVTLDLRREGPIEDFDFINQSKNAQMLTQREAR